MENERRHVILNSYGEPADFLNLTDSQIELLHYLFREGLLVEGVNFDIVEDNITFKDI